MKIFSRKALRFFVGLVVFSSCAQASEPSDEPRLFDNSATFFQTEVRELLVNMPLTREMEKNELHLYSFSGEAEKCLHLAVEQQGTDVIVTLISPSLKVLNFVERANTLQGAENMTYVLPESGVYTVKLTSNSWVELKNGYTIELKPFSVPNADDLKRIEAEKTGSEADALSFDSDSKKRKESVEKFKRAIALWNELNDDYEKMVAFYGLGWTYINESEFENAVVAFGNAAEMARRSGENFMLAHSLRAGAIANSNLGEYVSAIISLEESISIFRSLKMFRYIASGLQALGYAQYFLEDFANAVKSFDEALLYRRKVGDLNGEILTLTALAKTHSRMKNFPLALGYVEETKPKIVKSSVLTRTELLAEEGWILLQLRRFDEAEESFSAALKNYKQENSVNGQIIAHCGLAVAKQNKKEWQDALFNIEKSLSMVENLRENLTDKLFRLSFSAANRSYYEVYVNLLMELHRIYPNAGYDAKAFEASEKSRARVLLDLINESGFWARHNAPSELKNKLHIWKTKYVANLKEWKRLNQTKNAAELKNLNAEIQKLVLEKRELEAALKNKFTENAEFQIFRPVSAEKIQSLLDEDTILLEFGLYRNNYGAETSYLWAVSKNKIKGFALASRRIIEEKVRRAYRLLTIRNNFAAKLSEREKQVATLRAEKEYEQISAELGQILFENLTEEKLLDGKKKILVVADGILQSLPFAALPSPSGADKSRYLIADFEIVSLPSASILAALRERQKSRKLPEKTALVLADPVFSRNDKRFTAEDLSVKSAPTAKSKSVLRLADYFTQNDLPRLFNTRFEAEKISSYLPENQKRIELDFAATFESVTKNDLSNFRILHFATHALIDDETPELSGIALSMFDKKRQPIEGFLLSGDIFELKLNADLVVLSGCRTGLGKPVWGEGFIGLTQSFMYAGASRLLTSFWSVEDRATSQLMANFYKNHLEKKMSAAAALRQAQIEMIKTSRLKTPYFWAAFTLQGEYK